MKQQPSNLELQVLSVLWNKGEATVRDVLNAMPDRKQRAYTTILTVLQLMEKKGLVTHHSEGVAHVYKPTKSKRDVVGPILRRMMDTIFGGKPSSVMQHLLDDATITEEELGQIRALLEDYENSEMSKSKKGGHNQ